MSSMFDPESSPAGSGLFDVELDPDGLFDRELFHAAASGTTTAQSLNASLTATATVSRPVTYESRVEKPSPVVITVYATRIVARLRTLTASLTLTATATRIVARLRSITASLTLTATATRTVTRAKSLTASLTLTAATTRIAAYLRTLSASLTATATATRVVAYTKALTASLTLTATATRIVAYTKALTASLTVTAELEPTYIPAPPVPASGEVIDYGRMRKQLQLAQIRRQVLSEEDFILMLIIES